MTTLTPEQRQEIRRQARSLFDSPIPRHKPSTSSSGPTSTTESVPWPKIRGPPIPSR